MPRKPRRIAHRNTVQRGTALIEATILTPIAVAVFLGLVSLDQVIQSRRALMWSVGEVMLINNFREDIVDGADGSGPFTFVLNLTNGTADPASPCVPSSGTGGKSRCQTAYETSLLLARALRANLGGNTLSSLTVSFNFQDIGVGSGIPTSLSENRLLTIQATAVPAGRGARTLSPTVAVSRTEAIG